MPSLFEESVPASRAHFLPFSCVGTRTVIVSPLPTTKTDPGSVLTCWMNSWTLGRDHSDAGAMDGEPFS
jgi:hypothetical protein